MIIIDTNNVQAEDFSMPEQQMLEIAGQYALEEEAKALLTEGYTSDEIMRELDLY